jgi:hypothetical protein
LLVLHLIAPPHHSLPILLLVYLGSTDVTTYSPMQCPCDFIFSMCCLVFFLVPLCDFCRFHNACIYIYMPPHLPAPTSQCSALESRSSVIPSTRLSLVLFPTPSPRFILSSSWRSPPLLDVAASLCTATFVVAFASAPRHVTPAAVFQSDSASGASLVFVASSAACAAAFLLTIQRKDEKELPVEAHSKLRGHYRVCARAWCVCTAAATQLAFPDPPRHSHRLSSRNPLRQVAAAWAELVAAHRTLRDAPLATPTTNTASMISASIRTRCFAQFSRLEFLYRL